MTQATTTLFETLGGAAAIRAVITDFYTRVLADDNLKGFFKNTDMDRQREQQIAFVTMALDGPNEYNGRPMKEAHDGLGITGFHFDQVAGHLADALKHAGVSDNLIGEVLARVGPLKDVIVNA